MLGAAIVLAAGFSRRFGSDKRLFPVDGEPMVARTVEKYLEVFDHAFVVIKPEDEQIRAIFEQREITVVEAAEAHQGMSRSLAAGFAALGTRFDYAFVGLADMPFVRAATLRTLDEAMRSAPSNAIVRPRHGGQPGHPVGFSRPHFPAVMASTGDEGARQVIRAHRDLVVEIDVDDDGVIRDVDRPMASP